MEELHCHSCCEPVEAWDAIAKDRKHSGIAPIGNSTYLDLFGKTDA